MRERSNWGGAETAEIYANDAMTGTQRPCLGIAGDGGVAHVHHRVLDIRVPQPILHLRDIRAGGLWRKISGVDL